MLEMMNHTGCVCPETHFKAWSDLETAGFLG